MRSALLTIFACALAVPAAGQSSAFFPVGIDYPVDARTSSSEISADLKAVRAAGFNTIKVAISRREGEPAPGEYRLDALRRTVEVAEQAGLRVILQLDRATPAWVHTRHPGDDSRTGSTADARDDCADGPEARAGLSRFLTVAAKTAAQSRSLLAVDVGGSPAAGPCVMELVDAVRRAVPATVAVDRYGVRVDASMPASRIGAAIDAIGTASPPGWWVYVAAIPEPDRRFAAWRAISLGAQGLIFDDPPRDVGFIRTIASNPALFTDVRPRHDPVDVRIDGGTDIEVRFLESATVQIIVALNHSSKAQRVTMTFPPETPEAIWLNLETGGGVNFIAGPRGPLYQYWFRPKDALVLMIRKDIR